MSVTIEIVAAFFALGLAVDGARKVPNAAAFMRWLSSGNLDRLARRDVVYTLAAVELALGVCSVWAAGRIAAICGVLLVTPVGALLVRRTGVCACRGVVRGRTPAHLVVRNCAAAVAASASLVLLDAPIRPSVVVAVAGAWAAVELYRLYALRRAPVLLLPSTDHAARLEPVA